MTGQRAAERRKKRGAAALSLAALTALVMTATALAVTGQLTQLPDTAGCINEYGSFGCADGKALDPPFSAAVSADGKSVYVGSGNAVAVFGRNPTSGELTQLAGTAGCVSETGSTSNGDACADGKALAGAISVAVSPDDKNVYAASNGSSAVAVFQRDTTTGELTQLSDTAGCISQTGTDGTCADGKALSGAQSVAASRDGKNVYVSSVGGDAVAVFQRNTTTGELTQLAGNAGCIRELGGACRDGRALVDPTSVTVYGKSVYVTSFPGDAVAVLRRDTTTGALSQAPGTGGCVSQTGTSGACADGKALDGASAVAPSTDGKHVYVASGVSDAVAIFRRNAETAALTQLVGTAGCVSETGSAGACADGQALDFARSVAVSADGASVYVGSYHSNAIAVFNRDNTSGVLTQIQQVTGRGLQAVVSVAVSADGKSVYTTSAGDVVDVFARETPP